MILYSTSSETDSNQTQQANSDADPQMTLIEARTVEALQPWADSWNNLAFNAQQQEPMLSHAWLSTYFQHCLKPGEQFCCLLAIRNERLAGVLPLVMTTQNVLGWRRLVIRTPGDNQTTSVGSLSDPEYETEVATLFRDSLDGVFPRWQTLSMTRLPPHSPMIAVLSHKCRSLKALTRPAGVGAYLPTTGNFDDYLGTLKKNFKSNLKRLCNKAARLPDVRTEFLTGPDATEDQLERFVTVEAASWKGDQGSAIASSPQAVAFYRTLCRNLSALGWLEWHFLSTEGKTIAGNLAIRCGRSVLIWKLGYDADYSKNGPGTVLFEHLARRAFEAEDIDQIDLMTDMPWYDNWQMHKRNYSDLLVFPNRLTPIITGLWPTRLRIALARIPFLRSLVQKIRA